MNNVTIITQDPQMRAIIAKIGRIVDSGCSILLIGETGVGKEIFTEYIHNSSNRALQPFLKIGLSALPTELMESELFGHEKGAFTSANTTKKGLFELAHLGSLFLDDIDDVPLHIQTKLLRALETRTIMRVGGTVEIPIDVRLVTASKIDLKELVDSGKFRSDLYYRINVVPFKIPPLRKRKDDLELLINHFTKKFSPQKEIRFSPEAMEKFRAYEWPGNIRELRNIVQNICLFADTTVGLADLPFEISQLDYSAKLVKSCTHCYQSKGMTLTEVVGCVETNLINEALKSCGGNQSEAARMLGLNLSTFRDKLKKYNGACVH